MVKTVSFVTALLILYEGIFQTEGRCEVKYDKVGCYGDDLKSPRPLSKMLATDREATSDKYSGHLIDWANWNDYISDVVCRCARNASREMYGYFGIQYYGECWSGPNAGATYARNGTSKTCVTKDYQKCNTRSHEPCVGEANVNFVYVLSAHESSCHVKFDKIGCFYDNQDEPRPLPVMLMTDRDPSSVKYSGIPLSWSNWDTYIQGLACRCAVKTSEAKYKHFSLQNYGECWSGPHVQGTYGRNGAIETCIGKGFKPCSAKDEVCVGRRKANYVYRLH